MARLRAPALLPIAVSAPSPRTGAGQLSSSWRSRSHLFNRTSQSLSGSRFIQFWSPSCAQSARRTRNTPQRPARRRTFQIEQPDYVPSRVRVARPVPTACQFRLFRRIGITRHGPARSNMASAQNMARPTQGVGGACWYACELRAGRLLTTSRGTYASERRSSNGSRPVTSRRAGCTGCFTAHRDVLDLLASLYAGGCLGLHPAGGLNSVDSVVHSDRGQA